MHGQLEHSQMSFTDHEYILLSAEAIGGQRENTLTVFAKPLALSLILKRYIHEWSAQFEVVAIIFN